MQEEIELVADYCPEDCIYRSHISGGFTPICYYAAIENKVRGCKISECDKYRAGKPVRPRIREEYTLFWEYECYDEDADALW